MATHLKEIPDDFLAVTVYAGIDQSLNRSGLAFESEDGRILSCVMVPPAGAAKGVARIAFLHATFVSVLARCPRLRTVALEGYSFGSRFQREALGEVGGVLRLAIAHRKVHAVVATPGQVRKFVQAGSDKGKMPVISQVKAIYGIEVTDNNEADAIVLSQIARAADTRMVQAQFRREVLDNLTTLTPKSAPPARLRTRQLHI